MVEQNNYGGRNTGIMTSSEYNLQRQENRNQLYQLEVDMNQVKSTVQRDQILSPYSLDFQSFQPSFKKSQPHDKPQVAKKPQEQQENQYSYYKSMKNSYKYFSKGLKQMAAYSSWTQQPQHQREDSMSKVDPIYLALQNQENFDPTIFFQKGDPRQANESLWLSCRCFYQAREDSVLGSLTLKQDHLQFTSIKLAQLDKDEHQVNLTIDYLDIVSTNKLQVPNQDALEHQDKYVRDNYKFNFFLQIEVSAINGLTAVDSKNSDTDAGAILNDKGDILKRSNLSIASIFFKFANQEEQGFLINKNQEQVLDYLLDKLTDHVSASSNTSLQSMTCVPFYDIAVGDKDKNRLKEVQVHHKIKQEINKISQVNLSRMAKEGSCTAQKDQVQLIKYRIKRDKQSKILNDFQFSNLAGKLPSVCRCTQWTLLYRLSEHGQSMNTFLSCVKQHQTTVLIIEDQKGYKFGGFALNDWKVLGNKFFGSGESLVFTFKDSDQIQCWNWSGENEYYQFCDSTSLGMGGGTISNIDLPDQQNNQNKQNKPSEGGRFALFLGDGFYRGSSHPTNCFSNSERLSSSSEFLCVDFEVWGFM